MLELFGSGLVSLWLNVAGVPDSLDSLDAIELTSLQETPDRGAERTMKHYLKQLASEGLSETTQGVWLQSGAKLLATNQGTTPLPAASLTKVATTLAALETWGPDHQFETLIAATGPIQNGVLQGDLVIQGGGDPLFDWEEAIALGHSLNQIGISRITGNLLIVGNFMMNFEDDRTQSGALLKQALNSKTWDEDAKAEYEQLPKDTPRPTIEIKGAVKVLTTSALPKQILLLRHRSLPLTDLLKRMNVHSQNEMSQMLADNLGGVQATVQKAATAAGVSPSEIRLVNGSGLSIENRISPRAACAMFAAIDHYIHPRNLTIADLFPVSGWDHEGTLEDRDLPRAAVVKTGTLNEVSALTGVLPTRDRGFVWFAIINRGSNISNLRKQQEVFLKSLQQQWGPMPSPTMIEPSSWVGMRRATLGASARNEIVYGG
ncbi:D-alanyl-D-alanine carboxypeptidase [Phormidesmis priestleyi ULC007]|uniref:D-alanyl-D-alanine carboxypeptidase n=1 Tax=Phormidesmis priestleyi ULC007 TaxID=1920490 RepID=A0A2T1DL67_9CYAN|nr:D-alanyl-D-alanine carboxypeptidase [Phormidesmis priestleyi]PSB21248.1 D-alanyl-D-alanine carboxypeptidase [Phormidesmis priestleyi ULC007]PZO51224.1 MAG: D-alanyl-D-alanine carboxypeptidase [Phormidesmis priestleyi]